MAIIQGATYNNSGAAATTHVLTVPTGVTSGMVMLAAFANNANTAYTVSYTSSRVGATFTTLDQRVAVNEYVTVFKGTGLQAGDTVTLTLSSGQFLQLSHIYDSGFDYGTPSAGVRSASSAATVSGAVTPAVSQRVGIVAVERTTASGTVVSSITLSNGDTPTITQDAFAESAGTNQPADSVYIGHYDATTATSRTVTVTHSGASTNGYAAQLLMTALGAPVTATVTFTQSSSLAVTGATAAGGSVSFGSTSTLAVTPTRTALATVTLASTSTLQLTRYPAGYATVTEMLAQGTFYCAHRGGSRDYPEMSLYAYQQSALRGYPALEVSLARTSDGVWFGLHDASLDRTSLGTGGGAGTTLVASSMTWAQVQAYTILGSTAPNNPTQPDRPYMRWEELIAAFYDTHVLFVDPKVATAFRSELLDLMDACPGTPTERFVGKGYGVDGGAGNTGWAKNLADRGYRSWGYFYETDQANYTTYTGRWSILGEDYTAAQTAWDALLTAQPGKPVMGHIVPTQAAADTALAKLAQAVTNTGTTPSSKGLMASGVSVITPATVTRTGPVAFASTSTLTVTGRDSLAATVTLASSSTFAVTAALTQPATVALAGTSTLAVVPTSAQPAALSLASTSTLAVTATLAHPASVALTGTSTLTVAALSVGNLTAAVAFTSTSTLAVVGSRDLTSTVLLAGTSTLAVTARTAQAVALAFGQSGTFALTAQLSIASGVVLAGVSTFALLAAVGRDLKITSITEPVNGWTSTDLLVSLAATDPTTATAMGDLAVGFSAAEESLLRLWTTGEPGVTANAAEPVLTYATAEPTN